MCFELWWLVTGIICILCGYIYIYIICRHLPILYKIYNVILRWWRSPNGDSAMWSPTLVCNLNYIYIYIYIYIYVCWIRIKNIRGIQFKNMSCEFSRSRDYSVNIRDVMVINTRDLIEFRLERIGLEQPATTIFQGY